MFNFNQTASPFDIDLNAALNSQSETPTDAAGEQNNQPSQENQPEEEAEDSPESSSDSTEAEAESDSEEKESTAPETLKFKAGGKMRELPKDWDNQEVQRRLRLGFEADRYRLERDQAKRELASVQERAKNLDRPEIFEKAEILDEVQARVTKGNLIEAAHLLFGDQFGNLMDTVVDLSRLDKGEKAQMMAALAEDRTQYNYSKKDKDLAKREERMAEAEEQRLVESLQSPVRRLFKQNGLLTDTGMAKDKRSQHLWTLTMSEIEDMAETLGDWTKVTAADVHKIASHVLKIHGKRSEKEHAKDFQKVSDKKKAEAKQKLATAARRQDAGSKPTSSASAPTKKVESFTDIWKMYGV
jgi:hypothetical protein